MNKLMSWLTKDVFQGISNVIDNLVTTKEEKEKLKNELYNSLLQSSLDSDKIRATIVETEAKGNFLQRSWRPILMLAFGAIVVFHYFLYPVLMVFNSDLPNLPNLGVDFWDLLQIGIGGYVVGRSVEQVAKNITINKK